MFTLWTAAHAAPLAKRDVPLPVGATAPRFTGLPEKRPIAIVFFRGHW